MKNKWIVVVMILLSSLNVLGMEKDKNILSLSQNKKDHCERCYQYAKGYYHHGQSDISGFLCTECTNKRALFILDMVLGPCEDAHANKNTKK